MRKLCLVILLVFAIGIPGFSHQISGTSAKEYLARSLDIMVDRTLEAYNSEDYIAFFEYFAKNMNSLTTKQYFKAVYVGSYKKNLGRIKLKKLLRNESFIDPDFPVLTYRAKFEKHDMVLIIVNFAKEHDSYKITQIRFDRLLD